MNFDIEKDLLIELEVKTVLNSYFDNVHDSGQSFNFRCNVCNDSEKSRFKKRGHIYTNETPWMFHCYNCGAHMNVEWWLKNYFQFEYENVKKQLTTMRIASSAPKKDDLKSKIDKIKFKKVEKEFDEKKNVSFFKSIIKYPKLMKYCKDRLIPEEIYSKWFYSTGGMYEGRLIIPFFDDKGKIYYYQGRDLKPNSDCKYLSRMGDKLISVYNYYLVDRSLPVIILEGPIDSMFVENSVAETGLKKSKHLDDFPLKYYMLDNDKAGKKKSIKLLSDGQYVFNWKLFLREYPCSGDVKDVNDFIKFNNAGIRKLNFKMLEKYFTNSTNYKVFFC